MNILLRTLLLGALSAISFSAAAQWTWVDKDGRKVFSDRPPPAEVVDSNILRRPSAGSRSNADGGGSAATPSVPAKGQSAALKPKGTEKELAEKLKQADEADAARKQAEEERVARIKADNCQRARQARSTYDSGATLTRLNARGEREIIDDSARAAETQRLDGIIGTDCS